MDEAALTAAFENGQIVYHGASNAPTETGPQSAPTVVSGASAVPANAILVDGWTPGTSGDDVFELGTAQGNVSNSTGGDTYYVTDFADTSRHVLYLDGNDAIDISNVVTVPTRANIADYIQITRNTDTTAHIKVDTEGTGSNYQLLLTVKNMDEAALTAAFENGQIVIGSQANGSVSSLETPVVPGNDTNQGVNLSEPESSDTSQITTSSQQEEDIYSLPPDYKPGDVIDLGTLIFGGPDEIEPCGTCGDGDGNNFSQNTNDNQSNEASVEIIGVEHVRTTIISNSGGPVIGPVTLLSADDYLIEHGAKLEATYNANLAGLETLGLGNATLPEINFWMPFHLHETNAPEAWSIVDEKFFEARELVDQGYSVAEAQLIATGTTIDEFVFSDASGNYAEADIVNNGSTLAASGIDVSEGMVVIDPLMDGLPNFALPARRGMDPYDVTNTLIFNDWGEPPIQSPHAYSLTFEVNPTLSGQLGLDAFQAALSARPTPGNSNGASLNGTINDVGALDPLTPDWLIENLVYSFRIPNSNPTQSDYFINYTQSEHHQASDGIVVHHVELENNGSLSHHVYGEGDAFLQNTGLDFFDELVADRTHNEWEALSTQVGIDALEF
ncbi:MAG: hypothetical protein AAGD96_28725 [Chloroflexota bacterium]